MLTRQEDQVLRLEAEAGVHEVPVDCDLVAGDHGLDQAVHGAAAPDAGHYLPPRRPVVLAGHAVHDAICHGVGNMFRSPLHGVTSTAHCSGSIIAQCPAGDIKRMLIPFQTLYLHVLKENC